MSIDRNKVLAGILKEGYDDNLPLGFKEDEDGLDIELSNYEINDDSITIHTTNFESKEVLFEDFFDFIKKDNKLTKILDDYLMAIKNDLEPLDKSDIDPFDKQDRK